MEYKEFIDQPNEIYANTRMSMSGSKGMIRDLHQLSLLFKLLDVVIIYASLYVLSIFTAGIQWLPNYNLLGLTAALVYVFAAESAKLYQSWRGVGFSLLLKRVLLVWFVSIICLVLIAYLTKITADFSRVL